MENFLSLPATAQRVAINAQNLPFRIVGLGPILWSLAKVIRKVGFKLLQLTLRTYVTL